MHRNDLERVAVDHPITAEGLREVLDRLREQREHVEHYLDKAWHATTTDDRLLGEAAGYYVFALERGEWDRLADDLDLDERQLAAAIAAHRAWADDLLVLGTPSIRDLDDLDDDVEPFVLPYPENWQFAREMFGWQWAHLIQDVGLRPAELVDYWMTEKEQNTPDTWAGIRGVTAEAVRKNVRGAEQKIEQYREER